MPKTNVKVKLTGRDGNAFAIIGSIMEALKKKGLDDLANEFQKEAMSGDYNNVLKTALEYVEVS